MCRDRDQTTLSPIKEAAMTRAAAETHSQATGDSMLTTRSRRVRVDLMGLGAVLIAGFGLAGTIILACTPASEAAGGPSVSAAVASAPPVRDRWYLEDSHQAPGAPDLAAAAMTALPV